MSNGTELYKRLYEQIQNNTVDIYCHMHNDAITINIKKKDGRRLNAFSIERDINLNKIKISELDKTTARYIPRCIVEENNESFTLWMKTMKTLFKITKGEKRIGTQKRVESYPGDQLLQDIPSLKKALQQGSNCSETISTLSTSTTSAKPTTKEDLSSTTTISKKPTTKKALSSHKRSSLSSIKGTTTLAPRTTTTSEKPTTKEDLSSTTTTSEKTITRRIKSNKTQKPKTYKKATAPQFQETDIYNNIEDIDGTKQTIRSTTSDFFTSEQRTTQISSSTVISNDTNTTAALGLAAITTPLVTFISISS
ncbi:hypothetical protein, partial [Wolbachia endosymbiont of Pentidionis agamae]|uniref:hypothetical protein n=1 Tax=Wolbachia endosymbiont of Pentidionis agamae TaxID=3110435 RepID=UPI002FCF71FA